jgi:hypothetical protein
LVVSVWVVVVAPLEALTSRTLLDDPVLRASHDVT